MTTMKNCIKMIWFVLFGDLEPYQTHTWPTIFARILSMIVFAIVIKEAISYVLS